MSEEQPAVYVDSPETFQAAMKAVGMYYEVTDWLRDHGVETLAQAYNKVEDPTTMLSLIEVCGVVVQRDQYVAFAADCAEHVLPIWLARFPDDHRPEEAIKAARSGDDSFARAAYHSAFDASMKAAALANTTDDHAYFAASDAADAAAYAAFSSFANKPATASSFAETASGAAHTSVTYAVNAVYEAAKYSSTPKRTKTPKARKAADAEMRWQMECFRRWF